ELVPASGEWLGDAEIALDRLLGEQWTPGRDLTQDREHVRLRCRPRGTAPLAPDQLERTRLGRIAPQEPGAFEIREVRVHRGRRGEADCFPDLTDRRRVAVALRVLDEELPDLSLAGREHVGDLSFRTCVR